MTVIETIIGGVLLAIFTGVIGLLFGSKDKVTREEFSFLGNERRLALEEHKNSPRPHGSLPCEVHKVLLDTMDKKLDKIADKLGVE